MPTGEVWAGDTCAGMSDGEKGPSVLCPLLLEGRLWFSFTQVLKSMRHAPPTPFASNRRLRAQFFYDSEVSGFKL